MKIEKVYLTKENLEKIERIDDLFYKDAITGINWYLERYKEYHYAYFLMDDNSDLIGYIVSVPIKKELYEAITNGVILNDLHINPTMFQKESSYHYIVSCVILEEYRYQNYGPKLMETLLNSLSGKLCCLTISKDGYRLASKYLNLKETLNESVSVFTK